MDKILQHPSRYEPLTVDDLAQALRHAREAAGYSRAEAAALLDETGENYRAMERGLSLVKVVRILNAFETFGFRITIRRDNSVPPTR